MDSTNSKIIERLKDMKRILENRIWMDGGNELLEKFNLEMQTCTHCGHVSDNLLECPICGSIKNDGE